MFPSRAFRLGVTVGLSGLLARGCFDSDEKPEVLASDATTTGGADTGTGSSTTSQDTFGSTGDPDATCRDAIDCAAGCTAVTLGNDPDAELVDAIIFCILECGPGLNEAEAEKVLRLIECVTDDCVDSGFCDIFLPPPGTSSGGGDTTTSGGSSGTAGDTTAGDGANDTSGGGIDPVLQCQVCLIGGVTNENPSDAFTCLDEANDCQ